MILWTIQPEVVYEELLKNGVFHCKKENTPWHRNNDMMFFHAYQWLVLKLPRMPKYHYPIWAWHTTDWERKKPDLRCTGYAPRGEKMVCIEVEVPDNDVLLSDFDAWHFVLMQDYLDSSESEEESVIMNAWYDSLQGEKKTKAMMDSWENIFNITPFQNNWTWRGRYIQAVFPELKINQVKKVWHFTAR